MYSLQKPGTRDKMAGLPDSSLYRYSSSASVGSGVIDEVPDATVGLCTLGGSTGALICFCLFDFGVVKSMSDMVAYGTLLVVTSYIAAKYMTDSFEILCLLPR